MELKDLGKTLPHVFQQLVQWGLRAPQAVPAQLPLPAHAEDDVRAVLTCLEQIMRNQGKEDGESVIQSALGPAYSSLQEASREFNPEIMGAVLDALSAHLLDSEAVLLPHLAPQSATALNILPALVEKARQSFYLEKYTVSVVGLSSDLAELQQSLVNALTEVVEEMQEDLARKYQWTRGQTTCCPSAGYNPPPPSQLHPVHDPEAVKTFRELDD